MDKIIIKQAVFSARVGVSEQERNTPQEIILDITHHIEQITESDEINQTIDYVQVHNAIKELLSKKSYNLIETIASDVATLILIQFKPNGVTIKVKKPSALKDKNVAYTCVEITRHA